MASGLIITSWQIDGKTVETVRDFIFWFPKSLQIVTAAMKLKDAYSLEGKLWQTWIAYLKTETLLCQQRSVYEPPPTKENNKNQSYGFSSSHVWMWKLDCEESRVLKNWCFWTVVLEKTLDSPLDGKETQPVHPKGNQSRIFTGRTDAEVETPIFWPSDAKNQLIWKDPNAGKNVRLEEKGMTEDEMAGWHHQLDGHEFK